MIYTLFFVYCTSAQECSTYSCGSLQDNLCLSTIGNNSQVSPCPLTYYCTPSPVSNSSYCMPKSSSLPYVWPGESCQSAQCAYGYCNSSYYCIGKSENENCSASDECNPGLYCKGKTCTQLIGTGSSGCNKDFDCNYTAGCMKGVCVDLYSLDEGDPVDCIKNRSSFCKSSSCYKGYCLGNLTNKNGAGSECRLKSDCVSNMYNMTVFPFLFYSECSCSMNGKKYCDLFTGDVLYRNFTDRHRDWINSKSVLKCNTIRRYESDCIRSMWSVKKYQELMYYWNLVKYYSKITGVNDCVLMTLYSDYYMFSKLAFAFSGLNQIVLGLVLIVSF